MLQQLQPQVFLNMMLRALLTYFNLFFGSFSYSSLQTLSSAWMGECQCTTILRSLQSFSIRFKSGLWLGHLRTFTERSLLCYVGCMFRVGVLLEPLPQSEIQSYHQGCLCTSSFPQP